MVEYYVKTRKICIFIIKLHLPYGCCKAALSQTWPGDNHTFSLALSVINLPGSQMIPFSRPRHHNHKSNTQQQEIKKNT